jgi:DNA-binding transcriptional MerR regulator
MYAMITPMQAAETLKVSTSTLRRWSSEFEAFLSLRKGIKRLYSTDDLAILKRIKDYYKQGLVTSQIREALPVVEISNGDKALITIPDFADALMLAQANNAQLNQTVNDITKRLDALESYFSLPWYKKIGRSGP